MKWMRHLEIGGHPQTFQFFPSKKMMWTKLRIPAISAMSTTFSNSILWSLNYRTAISKGLQFFPSKRWCESYNSRRQLHLLSSINSYYPQNALNNWPWAACNLSALENKFKCAWNFFSCCLSQPHSGDKYVLKCLRWNKKQLRFDKFEFWYTQKMR